MKHMSERSCSDMSFSYFLCLGSSPYSNDETEFLQNFTEKRNILEPVVLQLKSMV